jgi:anti-sigma B factor antagonist
MKLSSYKAGDALVVKVEEDRIDAAAAIQFKDGVCGFAADGPNRVILDLTQVKFVDSSGLGAIVAVMKLLAPTRQLDLASLAPIVAKVFSLTRMDSVFAIYPDVDKATSTYAH